MRSSLRKQLSVLVQRRLHVERRRGKRIAPIRRTLCLLRASGSEERTTAIVQNLSRAGVALQADTYYSPGTLLHILLINEAHTFSLAAEVNIVRASRLGDHFVIAGPFTHALRHDEIVPFVI